MTFIDLLVILNKINNLCLDNVSIRINFYQNHFIDECAGKNFLKIPEFCDFVKTELFVRYKRTYVLNKFLSTLNPS